MDKKMELRNTEIVNKDYNFSKKIRLPVRFNLVETGLYIGNYSTATDIQTIKKLNIVHILTIENVQLPISIQQIVNNKFIQLYDGSHENILIHFDAAFTFIECGLKTGCVLIHCYRGMSRSSTIVLSYLMKKYQISFNDAFKKLKLVHSIASPNCGFIEQLRIYEKMKYVIDYNNLEYTILLMKIAANSVSKISILPASHYNLMKDVPKFLNVNDKLVLYKCKSCGNIIANENLIIPHTNNGIDFNRKYHNEWCKEVLFVQPLKWMKNDIVRSVRGDLKCEVCRSTIGKFSWIMGCKCTCGIRIEPGFILFPSKLNLELNI